MISTGLVVVLPRAFSSDLIRTRPCEVDLTVGSVVVLLRPVSAVVVLMPGAGKTGDGEVVVFGGFVGIQARL